MALITVGTSTQNLATAYSNGRHVVKANDGTLVLFAYVLDTTLAYKVSTDNGATWSVSWINVETSSVVSGQIDAFIESNDDIYLTYQMHDGVNGKLAFRKLTYSGSSWSVGTRIYVVTSFPLGGDKPHSLTKRANGDLWITQFYNAKLYGYYSTDSGATWNSTNVAATNERISYTIPYGSDIRAITQRDSRLTVYEYTSSWASGVDIVASGITDDNNGLGCLRISDSEIYVAARTSGGIKIFVWNGSSWDAGTLLSNHANDTEPTIVNVNGKPTVAWKDYDGTYYNIAYRHWNGASWDVQVDLMADSAVDSFPTGLIYDVNNMYLTWTTGASNPYTVYFTVVQLNTTKTQLINSDAKIVDLYQQTILSDAVIADLYQQTIYSDAKITALVLYYIANKISFIKQVVSDISNKFNSVISSVSNISNFINTCKAVVNDINNDIRTTKLSVNNVRNDVRFLYAWQKAATGTLQSLGKSYIKVYIGGVEQTDVDIDTGSISKPENSSHTAFFNLGRAYDATKPTIESTVLIKYSNWTLFDGYITDIIPSDSPESMRIECQNEFWKQNQEDTHFQVGQKPISSIDLFYDTIKNAIYTVFGWNLNIGNISPETISCYDVGKADALTNLITNAGNYSWFYDVDGTRKLIIAGDGQIINIRRQALGTNIDLHDLISHQFTESISGLTNRYRVQMGDIVRNKTKTYARYSAYHEYLTPAWDVSLEVLAKNSLDGFGVDSPDPAKVGEYSEVFKKYTMPYLDTDLSSWSDEQPPYLEVYTVNTQSFGFAGETGLNYVTRLTEGFTIDYDKKTITLNEPLVLYIQNAEGEWQDIRRPIIKAYLWKKEYFTYSDSGTNILEFYTAKMGTYPTTITRDLELSRLTIQDSLKYVFYHGVQYYVAPYDDSVYASDVANWQLSKVCDKKITGEIILTLDAVTFYNIDLTKRISITGITEAPMNIKSMEYDLNSFTVRLQLQNDRAYQRTVSLPYHGQE